MLLKLHSPGLGYEIVLVRNLQEPPFGEQTVACFKIDKNHVHDAIFNVIMKS